MAMNVVCGASTDPLAMDKPPQSLTVLRKMHLYYNYVSLIPYSAKFLRHLYFVDWPLKAVSLHNVHGMTTYRKLRLYIFA